MKMKMGIIIKAQLMNRWKERTQRRKQKLQRETSLTEYKRWRKEPQCRKYNGII